VLEAAAACTFDAGQAAAAVACCCLQHEFSQAAAHASPEHAGAACAVAETAFAFNWHAGEAVAAVAAASLQHVDALLQDFSQQPVHVAVVPGSAAVIRSIAKAEVANAARIKTAGVDLMSNPFV
jgi:hypothetical protein